MEQMVTMSWPAATQHKSCSLWTRLVLYLSSVNKLHWEKCTINVNLQAGWLISSVAAAHETAPKHICKCQFGPVRFWYGSYSSASLLITHSLPMKLGNSAGLSLIPYGVTPALWHPASCCKSNWQPTPAGWDQKEHFQYFPPIPFSFPSIRKKLLTIHLRCDLTFYLNPVE